MEKSSVFPTPMPTLLPGEQIEDLGVHGYRLIQPRDGFRFGTDALLLAAFARIRRGSRIAELGAGTGVIPILLCARCQPGHIDALEIQPRMADMAARSVALNGLSARICIHTGDLREISALLPRHAYQSVVSNPPYKELGGGLLSPNAEIVAAKQEKYATIFDVLAAAAYLLEPNGHFFTVFRPERLCDLFYAMRDHKIEPKRLRFVQPQAEKAPVLVLAEGIKGAKAKMIVEAPLSIQDQTQ